MAGNRGGGRRGGGGGTGRGEGPRPSGQVHTQNPGQIPSQSGGLNPQGPPPLQQMHPGNFQNMQQFGGASNLQGMPPWHGMQFPQFNQWPQQYLPGLPSLPVIHQQQQQMPIMHHQQQQMQFGHAPEQMQPGNQMQGFGEGQSSTHQQISQNQEKRKSKSFSQKEVQRKSGDDKSESSQSRNEEVVVNYDPKMRDVICYNCGEPAHFVGTCPVPKKCFICHKPGHHMDNYLEWYKPQATAQYFGSANAGLGFFHIESYGKEAVKWLNMSNVCVAVIEEGSITTQELKNNFSEIWKTNWPWQVRQLTEKRFLVRFPPHKKVKDLVELPSISLRKKGVTVPFEKWDGEEVAYAELQEVWVTMIGIPVNKLTWKVISQITYILGALINVDWHEIFRSFYEKVKVQVAVRDISKIPTERLVEIDKELFLICFLVDIAPVAGSVNPSNSGEEKSDDDLLEGSPERDMQMQGPKDMETDKSKNPKSGGPPQNSQKAPTKSKTPVELVNSLEKRVQSAILSLQNDSHMKKTVEKKNPEDNIAIQLLDQFDEESDGDEATLEVPKPQKHKWWPVVAPRVSTESKEMGGMLFKRLKTSES